MKRLMIVVPCFNEEKVFPSSAERLIAVIENLINKEKISADSGILFVNDGSRDHGAYPVSVYGREALRFYTYVVPLACIQYYPLMYLLGRWNSPWLIICPLAGGGLLLPAWAIWRLGLRHYRSTGS